MFQPASTVLEDRTEMDVDANQSAGKTSRTSHAPLAPWMERAFDTALVCVLFGELVLMFANTVLRAGWGQSIDWANEVAEFALTTLAFVGGAVAYHRGQHMSVQYVLDRLPAKLQHVGEAAGHYITLVIAGLAIYLAYPMFTSAWSYWTPVLQIPKSWTLLPYMLGMALLAIFAVRRLIRYPVRISLEAGALVGGLGALWFVAQQSTERWNGPGGILFAVFLLLVMVFCGVPIAFVLTIVAYLYLMSASSTEIIAIPFAMQNGISSFILLAVPFFILAGNIMTEGGLTKPLADWVCSLVGRFRGGLMQAVIVGMYIFSGISGSKIADVAAVGTALKGMLKEQGYQPAESTAVFASAGIMGETIPPSLVMMVLASITTLSVGTFFVTGMVPATLMALSLMIFIYFRARAKGWPRCAPVPWGERVRLTVRAFPALLVPVILVVGIVGGIATPTEASSFAVVYAIVVALTVYRSLGVRGLLAAMGHSAVTSGMILFMVSAGGAFSWTLTIGGLPDLITRFLNSLGGSGTVFMVTSIVTLVVMGSMLEGLPSLLIFGPLLLPLAGGYGINELHFGIVLIIAMGIGTFIPPFGICYFVTCSVLESTVEDSTPRFLPYLVIIAVGLILIAAVPWFSLALPAALHLSVK
ncbi:MAG TPA: TRAP transporter large permease subunit [Candidatus Sulfotelmatobacter sp.]|nr:TRAP transporter large permease subunit [Candidatus Sulfotelmatobacter sp.]